MLPKHSDISDSVMSLWERFVVLLYVRTSDHMHEC